MATGLNPLNIMQRWKGASDAVVGAIQAASQRTGVSFDYLMNKAQQESSFNPTAKAGSSSATGLFQFIESTWLSAVKSYGDQFGLGNFAAKISDDGKVSDAATRKQILDLRKDPSIAANMTAAMTKDNASYLETSLGGKIGQNELYLAHFMGLNGAEKFLKAKQANPLQPAADLFPAAASANKNVFYDQSGRKRSISEVYDFFAKKMDPAGAGGNPVTLLASATPSMPKSVVIQPAGQGFVMPGLTNTTANAQKTASDMVTSGERHMLESLLAGVNNFGVVESKNTITGSVISPYTAFILAKLQSPDETSFISSDSVRNIDTKKDSKSAVREDKQNQSSLALASIQ